LLAQEQLNLDLSNKIVSQQEQWCSKQDALEEKLQASEVVAGVCTKFYEEIKQLSQQAIRTHPDQKLSQHLHHKLSSIQKQKQQQLGTKVHSIVFERDHLQAELDEAMHQIHRLTHEKEQTKPVAMSKP